MKRLRFFEKNILPIPMQGYFLTSLFFLNGLQVRRNKATATTSPIELPMSNFSVESSPYSLITPSGVAPEKVSIYSCG